MAIKSFGIWREQGCQHTGKRVFSPHRSQGSIAHAMEQRQFFPGGPDFESQKQMAAPPHWQRGLPFACSRIAPYVLHGRGHDDLARSDLQGVDEREPESDKVAAVAGCTTIFLGALPTGIVATTDRESRFTTERSLEPSFVT